jgi:hypothetical protein
MAEGVEEELHQLLEEPMVTVQLGQGTQELQAQQILVQEEAVEVGAIMPQPVVAGEVRG